jgi:hypothetical protein
VINLNEPLTARDRQQHRPNSRIAALADRPLRLLLASGSDSGDVHAESARPGAKANRGVHALGDPATFLIGRHRAPLV